MTQEMTPSQCWVEIECPIQKVDFDTDDLPRPADAIYCTFCGGMHIASEHGQAFRRVGNSAEVLSLAEWEAETA